MAAFIKLFDRYLTEQNILSTALFYYVGEKMPTGAK